MSNNDTRRQADEEQSRTTTAPDKMADHRDDADESQFASREDFQPSRDGDGERVPVTHEIPGINGNEKRRVKFKPLNYGDVKRYFGDGSVHDVNEDVLARVFTHHVIVPDLAGISGHERGRVTANDVDELYPLDPRYLLEGLFDASGISADIMMDGAEGQVEIQGN